MVNYYIDILIFAILGIIQLRNGLEQEIFAFGVEYPLHAIMEYDEKYLQMDLSMINHGIFTDQCPIRIQGILDLQREYQNGYFGNGNTHDHHNGNERSGMAGGTIGEREGIGGSNGNNNSNGNSNNNPPSNQGGINRKLRRKRKGSLAEEANVTSNSSSTSLLLSNIDKITPFPINVHIMTSALDQEYQIFIEDPFSGVNDTHESFLPLKSAPLIPSCEIIDHGNHDNKDKNEIERDENKNNETGKLNDNNAILATLSKTTNLINNDQLELRALETFYREQCQEYEMLLLYYRVLSQADDIIVKKLLAIEEYDDRMKKLGARIKQNLSPEDFIRTLASINK